MDIFYIKTIFYLGLLCLLEFLVQAQILSARDLSCVFWRIICKFNLEFVRNKNATRNRHNVVICYASYVWHFQVYWNICAKNTI